MKHLKYFESASDNFYREIDMEEYYTINGRIDGQEWTVFDRREKEILQERCKCAVICVSELAYIGDEKELYVKKGYDDWFLVKGYVGRNHKWWICDQFDGLLKLLDDLGFLKSSQ